MTEEEIAAAELAALATAAAVDTPAPAVDLEHEAAVARGDVFVPPGEEAINPDFLAEIAGEPAAPIVAEVKKDDGTIPRARFNEVNEENRRLKEQLEASKVAPPVELEPAAALPVEDPRVKLQELRRLQKDYDIEGDIEKFNETGDQIDDLLLQIATDRAEGRLEQKTSLSTVKTSMETVATAAYEKYPFLDVNSPNVDEDAVNSVITRRNELVTSGKSLVEALQTAIDEKGPKFARLLGIEPTSVVTEGDKIRAERDRAALEKAADASILQPAALPSRAEKDSFAVNVNNLTPAQIEKLPEEQKARLRGDTL